MSRPFLLTLATVSLTFAGCTYFRSAPIPKAQPIHFPAANTSDGTKGAPKQIGRIVMVNGDGGFVLIEASPLAVPAEGTALKCFRDGVEVGVVAVNPERRGGMVTADKVTGEPQRGDLVFQ